MNVTHTISALEIIWTVIAVIGVLFTSQLVYKSVQDYDWLLTENANGDRELRRYVGLTSIMIYAGGIVTQLGYLAIGIVAMTQSNRGGEQPSKAQVAISIIFIACSGIGSILAGIIYKRRDSAVKEIVQGYVRRDHA